MMDSLIAYLSMEVGFETDIPTYSGGLGVLAGDSLRSAADLGLPMVAVSLVYHQGYLRQNLDELGHQSEAADPWDVGSRLQPVDRHVTVTLEGRPVKVGAWRYDLEGLEGHTIPVFLLDCALPDNEADDRLLTHSLYGGDQRYRLKQEVVLGLAGLEMLRALGYRSVTRFHLNEGHAALIILGLLEEKMAGSSRPFPEASELEQVRRHCVFTTHTPVAAGHDRFPSELVEKVLGRERHRLLAHVLGEPELHMTHLGLAGSEFVNGVAMRHSQVSQRMFPEHSIRAITNGIHVATWAAPSFETLFDENLPNWRGDPVILRNAIGIADDEIWTAHQKAKAALSKRIEEEAGLALDLEVLTIGFARRATPYKRADLLFHDLERLRRITERLGPLQLVFSGKAHPLDQRGKDIIARIHDAGRQLGESVRVAYLPNYDMEMGKLITAGVDVWLNNPRPPQEASGTSGMKAALNGVPSLSILDGWWIEGHAEGVTGWSIGGHLPLGEEPHEDESDAHALYDKLENTVLPAYYQQRAQFVAIMRQSIAFNASFFHTHRMMRQYIHNAYGFREPL